MASINANLKLLSRRQPNQEDMDEINRQIEMEHNDRGAAVLAATVVENAIGWAICRRLPGFAKYYSKLFEENGIISTLDARITIAEVLNMFGDQTKHNLSLIKHIRNCFAHAGVPVTFSTPEIEAACFNLKAPAILNNKPFETPRQKFLTACYFIAIDIADYGARCLNCRADLLDPATMVPMTPPSLP